jgi:transcriptional regulator with XRE-family HTH domain
MIEEIGRKIKDLRLAADLTQGELAERADLTDGFISQVERGRTSISIDSLKQILDALNISLSDFFQEETRSRMVFGQDEQIEIEEGGDGRLVLLVPGATNRRMEPALLTLKSSQRTSLRTPFQGDCFGFVLKGRIQIQYGSEHHRVKTGESFYFTADREYQISNVYRGEAEVLWLTTPPMF